MTIASLESLSFGLARTVEAATAAGHRLCLLTGDRGYYHHELTELPPGAALDVVDVDTTDLDAVRKVLTALPDLAGLINTTDTWSVPAADLAADLGLPGPDPASVRVLRDKAQVREALHRAGLSRGTSTAVPDAVIAAARTGRTEDLARLLTALRPALVTPVVLKDSAGTSSRGVWIAHDEQGLWSALAAAGTLDLRGRLFAEPYLAGPLYSAETLSWDGETRLLGVTSRHTSRTPAVREEAAAFPVALDDDELSAIEQRMAAVLAAVGHRDGFAHIEFIQSTHGPEIVEINRRIGGALLGEALCRSLGVNVYEALIATVLGRRPELMDIPLEPRQGPSVAFVLVYAERPGVVEGFNGLDGLRTFPGGARWYPVRVPGDTVSSVADQRGCTGMVLAEAPTAELAQHRAWSAATTVHPVLKTVLGP
ncbi:ATP-grasp domain-containing protein [Streptomyces sp. NPDC005963]|uniref:ATP-grasp domain-containing protein n=1 Tax=Streptomyces sp. NPDC005963 TaxID=3156721 RepID=UPI0033F0CAC8